MLITNITHSDLDGVVSSILLHDYFDGKEGIEFTKIKATYRSVGDIFKRYYTSTGIFFITDISLPDESIIPNIEDKTNIILLDHHPQEVPSKIKKQIVKINEGAGCKLVYNYLLTKNHIFSEPLKKLMLLGNDYDTWVHAYPFSKKLNYLFYYYGFMDFFERFKCGIDQLLDSEKKFLMLKQKEIENILNRLHYDEINSRLAFVIANHEIDEIADFVIHKHNFENVIIFNKRNKVLSFRNRKDSTIDLGKFLKQFNGGGHKNAAGVAIKDDNDIANIIEKFCEILT